jgi:cytochrome bd-type quinol oxidase subunit 1
MLDDIIIVAIAGFTMKFLQFNTNYSRYSRLVAGLLMLVLGLILLVKPEILFF